jgi:hypothetical protein
MYVFMFYVRRSDTSNSNINHFLCAVTSHNAYQNYVCVVPLEDGHVMPETCRGFKPE